MKQRAVKLAAMVGLAFNQSSAEVVTDGVHEVSLSDTSLYKAELNENTPLYLAAHRSHSSHGSHRSHRSHRSYYNNPVPDTTSPNLTASEPLGQKAKPLSSYPPVASVSKTCNVAPDMAKRKETIQRVQMYLFLSGHYKDASFDGVMNESLRNALGEYKSEFGLASNASTILDSKVLNSMALRALKTYISYTFSSISS